MQILNTGRIMITKIPDDNIQAEIVRMLASNVEFTSFNGSPCIGLNDVYGNIFRMLKIVTERLEANDIHVTDGYISYDGICRGAYIYRNGRWEEMDADEAAARELPSEALADELLRRGLGINYLMFRMQKQQAG